MKLKRIKSAFRNKNLLKQIMIKYLQIINKIKSVKILLINKKIMKISQIMKTLKIPNKFI